MTACTITTTASIEEILKATPEGKIAMFRVDSIPSKCDDWLLGECVYIHQGKVWDFIADECNGLMSEFGLHFVSYIDG